MEMNCKDFGNMFKGGGGPAIAHAGTGDQHQIWAVALNLPAIEVVGEQAKITPVRAAEGWHADVIQDFFTQSQGV